MYRAVVGNKKFRESEHFRTNQGFFRSLADGQDPKVIFFTCSDSRVEPSRFTSSDPGSLFTHKNVGNTIPPYPSGPEVAATIEYGLKGLNPTDIIVCGHTECGAMRGLLNPESIVNMDAVKALLKNCQKPLDHIHTNHSSAAVNEQLLELIKQNVLQQIEHLKTYPAVKEGMQSGRIKVHGWVFNVVTNEILAFDESNGSFIPVEETEAFKIEAAMQNK